MDVVKSYYQAIYRCLPLKKSKKKQYLSAMLNSLKEYKLEKPDVTYEELVENFGTPDFVATGIMEVSSEDVAQTIKFHSKKTRVCVCVIGVMLILCLLLSHLLTQKYKSKIIYVQSEIEEYESWPFVNDENAANIVNE